MAMYLDALDSFDQRRSPYRFPGRGFCLFLSLPLFPSSLPLFLLASFYFYHFLCFPSHFLWFSWLLFFLSLPLFPFSLPLFRFSLPLFLLASFSFYHFLCSPPHFLCFFYHFFFLTSSVSLITSSAFLSTCLPMLFIDPSTEGCG
ncbi:hypothetical protein FIBSPDRAFT_268481 [Athelia psychrophila]|uniref:Uncharacterized protein n=1 Tax=Athelia psychrophila TaxID=1759441 RepID=A0A166RIV4_9AGAM|nr:hypothetical protein FIBSPDRAFT_268481 [Fibularhizoctonia sp. CBS 109695]